MFRRILAISAVVFAVSAAGAVIAQTASQPRGAAPATRPAPGQKPGPGMGPGPGMAQCPHCGMAMHGHGQGMDGDGGCPMAGRAAPMSGGGCPMALLRRPGVRLETASVAKGASITITADDPKLVQRIQKSVELMRLRHELMMMGD